METAPFKPGSVHKPIQLLAAWLVGLLAVDGAFLTAAAKISEPTWIAPFLVIAAVLNVPMFLLCVFLLQTKFRPEMQEDQFYSEYLQRRFSGPQGRTPPQTPSVENEAAEIERQKPPLVDALRDFQVTILSKTFEDVRTLAELYKNRDDWKAFQEKYGKHDGFRIEVVLLWHAGLLDLSDGWENARLSTLGERVARDQEQRGELWHQRMTRLKEEGASNKAIDSDKE